MPDFIHIAVIGTLIAFSCDHLWARVSLRQLTIEEKARVLEASSYTGIWVPMCFAILLGSLFWAPLGWLPRYYAPGVLASYVAAPFIISIASRWTTYLRLSRLGLPEKYLRIVRFRAVAFHVALLFLICVLAYDIFRFVRSFPRQSSNQAMEQTASGRYILPFGDWNPYPVEMTSLARGSSSWSR